ncbi:MAG: pitrilysin family protein, partial [Phycisphaeraceae bacterium]
HPARHPTIGYLDEFLAVTRDEIYDFYRTMYVPNNMVFVVSGDINKEAVVQQVRSLWGEAESKRLPGIVFPVEESAGAPVELTGQADIDRPRLRIAWPGTRLGGEHDYALDLLSQILGQGELSRLAQSVRDEQQLVTSISAYNASFAWGEGFFGIDATVVPGKVDEARDAILAEVARISRHGVMSDELQRAKSKTVASVVYSSQTAEATAARLAGDFIHTGDPDYLQRYAEAIEQVTAGDLLRAARAILEPEETITVKLMPQEGDIQPLTREDPPVAAATGREPRVELVDLDNSKLVARMKALDTRTSAVTPVEVGPVRMHTLPNGLRLITQRNTQLPVVAMQWYHLGGLLGDEPGSQGLASATMQM